MQRPTDGELIWLGAGSMVAIAALLVGGGQDFASYIDTASAWRDGQPLYPSRTVVQNLNPPAILWITVPFALVPPAFAFRLWTIFTAACFAVVLWRVRSRVPADRWWWLVGAYGITFPAHSWLEGSLLGILAVCVSAAWLSRSRLVAGLWLGAAVALKPPLALLVLALPIATIAAAAVAAATISGLTVAVSGVSAYRQWTAIAGVVDWIGIPSNASLWGMAARWSHGSIHGAGMVDVPALAAILIISAGLWCLRTARRAHHNRRLILGTFVVLLFSPVGWASYLMLAFPMMAVDWRGTKTLIALACVPLPALWVALPASPLVAFVAGSIWCGLVLAAWVLWTRAEPAQPIADILAP